MKFGGSCRFLVVVCLWMVLGVPTGSVLAGHLDVSVVPSNTWIKEPGIRLDFGEEDPAGTDGFHTPYVFRFPDGTLRMYYDAFGTIPRLILSASSTDGLVWIKEPGVRLSSEAVDVDAIGHPHIVQVSGGPLRMYFEAVGLENAVRSATSTDGLTWVVEPGVRLSGALDPVAFELPGGGFRMYFRSGQSILSSVSADGLNFVVEPGVRVGNAREFAGLRLQDGTVLLYYGTGTPAFDAIRSARSPDGLNFTVDAGDRVVPGGHPDSDPFDSGKVLTTSIVQVGVTTVRMYYQASPTSDINDQARVFSAVAELACEPVEEPDVSGQGFWKRQCQGSHPSGEWQKLPEYVEGVNDAQTFADVSDANAICDRLSPNPPEDKCEQVEAQFMAQLLNLASGRVAICSCVEDPFSGSTTVGAAAAFIDGLLANPLRTFDDCILAQQIADGINEGMTLAECPN